jgi:hypothetical protein
MTSRSSSEACSLCALINIDPVWIGAFLSKGLDGSARPGGLEQSKRRAVDSGAITEGSYVTSDGSVSGIGTFEEKEDRMVIRLLGCFKVQTPDRSVDYVVLC